MTKKKRNKSEKNTNDNDSSVPSFSIFDFVTLSSLLPPKPLVASVSSSSSSSTIINGNEKNENSKYSNSKDDNNNSYVYPVTDFPSISSFEVSMEFPALIVPVRRTNELRNKLKSIMLSRPLLSVIVELSDADDGELLYLSGANENRKVYRKIVLDPKRSGIICIPSSTSYNNDNSNNNTKMNDILKSLLEEEEEDYGNNCRLGRHTITLSYEDWTTEEILTRLLVPEGIQEIPSAFEAVGHLAHVNLRKELLPYKYLVGKVLLEKNSPRIQTVVNKLGSIDTKYRTFGMEIIANGSNGNGNGNSNNNNDNNDNWSDVVVKEEGCEYRLDFRKVYWNSRLGGEHRRLVQLIQQDAVNRINKKPPQVSSSSVIVADLMAGIGPFAIPLTAGTKMMMPIPLCTTGTKKTTMPDTHHASSLPIEVYANDLNPSSYDYLVINAKRNKCDYINCNDDLVEWNKKSQSCKLYVYNMDARAFCHQLQDRKIRPDHYIMNLPATALEFLDAFRGYPTTSSLPQQQPQQPQIHVHCFAPKDIQESKTEIWNRIETALGCSLDEKLDNVTIYPVRDVAPNKNMYCVSFTLPKAVSGLSRIQIISNQKEEVAEDQAEEIESDSNKRRKMGC
jgi:tRNA (guanine37-N1)-methyltransferase